MDLRIRENKINGFEYFIITILSTFLSIRSCSPVRGWAEKFIGWLRKSCATAMNLNMHEIQPFLKLISLFLPDKPTLDK